MTNFVAKQVQKRVPIYDLFADGADIGSLTIFPGEGPMATVKFDGASATFSATTIHEVLVAAKEGYFDLIRYADDDHIEDEDGEMARMRYEENKADDWASRREMDEPDW